jgi:hypothetical protein
MMSHLNMYAGTKNIVHANLGLHSFAITVPLKLCEDWVCRDICS